MSEKSDFVGHFSRPMIHVVWIPIASFFLAEIVVGLWSHTPVLLPADIKVAAYAEWNEAAARMQLLGMALLFCLSAVVVVGKFLIDLAELFTWESRWRLLCVFGLTVLSGVIVVTFAYKGIVPRSYDLVGHPLFEKAFAELEKFSGAARWNKGTFNRLVDITNIVTGLAVPAFIAGGISRLAIVDGKQTKEAWRYQSQRLTNYILASAGFLVIGTVYMKTWTQYPGFLLEATALPFHTAVVNAYTTYSGIEYTLLLGAYALPVSLLLTRQAKQIAITIATDAVVPPPAKRLVALDPRVQAVRESEKLQFSTQDLFKTILAVLAPVITGGIASLSTILGKG